jgi:hypothetical protein
MNKSILTLAQIDHCGSKSSFLLLHGQIRAGSKAEVRPEQPVGGIYSAIVTVVDRVLDAASGTFSAVIFLT